MNYDYIVIGAGIEGSATAYSLAQMGYGKQTLLLEQFPLPHTRGSSHGASRITRRVYSIGEPYVKMMSDAHDKWDKLQRETGQHLFTKTGLLRVVAGGEPALDKLAQPLRNAKLPYELLNVDQINERFNGALQFANDQNDWRGLFDPEAGMLHANKCLSGFQKIFEKHGGTIKDGEPVTKVEPCGANNFVRVHTNKRMYNAKTVVLCTGPWGDRLLRTLAVKLPLRLCQDAGDYHSDPDSRGTVDPDKRDLVLHNNDKLWKKASDFLKQHYPGVDSTAPAISESCILTYTPDEHFILDRVPNHPNIIFGLGMSGHAFKLAPVVGDILAHLALNRTPPHDMTYFGMNRFGKNAKL